MFFYLKLGKAVHTSMNGSNVEECFYVSGLRQGSSVDKRENGDVEERNYLDGVLEGEAVLLGGNGDRLEFTYKYVYKITLVANLYILVLLPSSIILDNVILHLHLKS